VAITFVLRKVTKKTWDLIDYHLFALYKAADQENQFVVNIDITPKQRCCLHPSLEPVGAKLESSLAR
jgi:hypothetical protein